MSLDPKHPTLHLASDLAPGWTVLHLGGDQQNRVVATTGRDDDGAVLVSFEDGTSDQWPPDARVHATEPSKPSDEDA